jgi:hypothetical protein
LNSDKWLNPSGLNKGGKIMKKMALITGMVIISCFFISHGLYAQRFYRDGSPIEDDYYDLNLTQEQMEKIDIIELELEKELSPLIAKLRSNYVVLDELEAQRSPDPKRINNVWDVIYRLEEDIQNKEILHEKKIRDLLTEDQKAVFDAYYAYGTNPYGRGDFGRGYFGSGSRGFQGSNYGYGGYGYGAGMRRTYSGRGAGRLGRSYYGYGRGIARGYGMNRGNFGLGVGRGAGQLGYGNGQFLRGVRYGRGPCGAGLGRWYRWNYNRVGWNWKK